MHRAVKKTQQAFIKHLGIEHFEAGRLAETVHCISKMMQIHNEIECNVDVRSGCLETVSEALEALATDVVENQLGMRLATIGDARGCPLRLVDPRLPNNGWEKGLFYIEAVTPWETKEEDA